jgi:hypothetical protein
MPCSREKPWLHESLQAAIELEMSTIQQEFETQTPSMSASGQVDLSGSFPRSFV